MRELFDLFEAHLRCCYDTHELPTRAVTENALFCFRARQPLFFSHFAEPGGFWVGCRALLAHIPVRALPVGGEAGGGGGDSKRNLVAFN